MKYEKPSVSVLAEAANVIQSGVKGIQIFTDVQDPTLAMTNGAYESDE